MHIAFSRGLSYAREAISQNQWEPKPPQVIDGSNRMQPSSTGTSTSSSPGSKERVDSNADGVEEFCKNEITDGIQHDRDEQRGDGNALIGGEGAVVEPLERDGLDGDGKAHLGGGGGVTVHQDDDKENDEFNEEEKKEEDSNILSELISMFCHLVLCRSMNLTRFLSISCFETKRTSWSDSSTSC
jgi:hypothetical protein